MFAASLRADSFQDVDRQDIQLHTLLPLLPQSQLGHGHDQLVSTASNDAMLSQQLEIACSDAMKDLISMYGDSYPKHTSTVAWHELSVLWRMER